MPSSRENPYQAGPPGPPSTAVGFQQQGTIDWTTVANGTVSFSVKVLSQLSKAGVEALTICAARAIFSNVKLGNNGELRLHRALQNIRAFPSIDKVLWFGFGVRHIIWNMQESAEGLACLAICASLTESYTTTAAAKIMRDLFLVYKPPSELTPSLSQWKALVEASEGLLAPTEFGLVLHGLTKLYARDGLPNTRACGPPKDIAIVLRQLFEVSAGRMDRFYLSGGADCAWIAAVAHWLLDLRVEIQDQDGTTLYRPDGTRSQLFPDAQVIIAYSQDDDEPHVSLQVTQKHYVIPSGHVIFVRHPSDENDILSYGRVAWDTCLVDTFGTPMKLLLGSQARSTGVCLGSAARIFSAVMSEPICLTDTPDSPNARPGKPPVSSSAYGRGFYLLARRQFEELDQTTLLVQTMETALDQTYLAATQQLSQSFASLGRLCLCEVCDPIGDTTGQHDAFCLILLIQTICTLVRIMSVCHMQQGLEIHPSRSGIERIYWNLKLQRSASLRASKGESFEREILWNWAQHDSLTWMQILFTGRGDGDRYSTSTDDSVVATRNGLCFCLNTLTEITCDPQRACVILVMPGKIEWNTSIYDHVRDIGSHLQIDRGGPYSAVSAAVINQYDDLADSSSTDLISELIVEETTALKRVLDVTYRITTPDFPGKCFLVGPRMIWDRLNEAFTAASCQGRICRSLNGFQSILVKGEGLLDPVARLPVTHLPITCVLSSQDLAIWVALGQTHIPSSNIIMELSHRFQGEQCVRCCIVKSEEYQGGPHTRYVALIRSI
ncbi:hypothetical protein ACHAPI_012095 [Fusarium lateritium]